ncbi:MAG: TraR/DksA family transcriptional regulator [Pseudomonadota bacterium]|nr:TraR/DksA family transcriptional regulator [Pseudomonadota bacterium]
MADIVDDTTTRDEMAWSKFKPYDFSGESSEYCIECGEKIPERRRLVGNMHHCVGCQEAQEKISKHRR